MKRRDLFIAVIVLLLFWQSAAWIVNRPILPSPIEVARVIVPEIRNGLIAHFMVSLWRVVASTLLSIALAAPAGLILGQSKKLNALLSPIIYLVYPIPKVVFVPVVLLFLGLGDAPKIAIIFLILFFQILVAARTHSECAQPGSRTAGLIPLRLSARQPASNPDGAPPVGRNGGRGFICRRTIRHSKGPGILHLSKWKHAF